jgi:hypothetical protein
MSVTQRSSGDAGRPQGRPAVNHLGGSGHWSAGRRSALHALAALIALLAIGATTVLSTPTPAGAQADGETTAPAPTEPPPTTEPAPPAPAPSDPASTQPPVVQSDDPPSEQIPTLPQGDGHATYNEPAPTGDPAPAPAESVAPESQDESAPPAPDGGPGSDEPSQPTTGAVAQNVSTVLQAIWQFQVGCRTYCNGTSQTQSASQESDTGQHATAVAPDGQSSGAAAVNQSSTIQFVWQTQLGCVAFCWNTTMGQSASQDAQTTQMATAVSDFGALAENLAETMQYVWQVQEGCRVECYGVSESQSLSQQQNTTQSATATGPRLPTSAGSAPNSPDSFFSWVTAFAQNIGATVQWILQFEEASCLEHCGDEALFQTASQRAATDQTATAGDVPEPPSEPPTAGEPPPAAGAPPAAEPSLPGSAPTAAATIASSTSGAALGAGELTAEGPLGGRSTAARAERGPSPQVSLSRSSVESTATTAGPGGEASVRASGTAAESSSVAAQASTRDGTSASTSHSSTRTSASPAPAAHETRTPTSDGDDLSIPWLPVALLLVAGLAVFQSLRLRPGFGG